MKFFRLLELIKIDCLWFPDSFISANTLESFIYVLHPSGYSIFNPLNKYKLLILSFLLLKQFVFKTIFLKVHKFNIIYLKSQMTIKL